MCVCVFGSNGKYEVGTSWGDNKKITLMLFDYIVKSIKHVIDNTACDLFGAPPLLCSEKHIK